VARLGLAANPQTDPRCVSVARQAGVNLFFFYNLSFGGLVDGLADLGPGTDVLLATGSESRDPDEVEAYLDEVCERLAVDGVDLLFTEYVNPGDDLDELLDDQGIVGRLHRLKAAGRIRYVGATVHSRPLAEELLASGRIDVLMHRYNMAHVGAEERVLPAAQEGGVPVIAFTCTRWAQLLKGHGDGGAGPPSAADCYRFALHHPAVHVALTAAATVADLESNLAVLEAPAATDAEMAEWRRHGALVYGEGGDSFETQWP
jgi:aryl-alcohol dehydrogenase-like predicted oxidoreductase